MNHSEGTFSSAAGLTLYYQCWKPDQAPRAALCIVHGIGEHSGRYASVVDYLLRRGYAIYSFDLRGHGRSPGRRGHVDAWEEYRGDVAAFLRTVGQQETGRPIFLMGHSMGGLIVLEYVLHHPEGLHGVIASAPGLSTEGLSPLMVALARLLSHVLPRLTLKTGLTVEGISRDAAVVQAYRDDPLVHDRATPRTGVAGQTAIAWTLAHAADLSVPLLIVHGTDDQIVPCAASQLFYDRVTMADKERRVYEGGYHELHNDLDREQVLADVADWLERHIP
ncbi:MAG: lysophospholipase [Anaerolineae bacterium]|nr:lysophospholipase [Anaerolineae bacterium]